MLLTLPVKIVFLSDRLLMILCTSCPQTVLSEIKAYSSPILCWTWRREGDSGKRMLAVLFAARKCKTAWHEMLQSPIGRKGMRRIMFSPLYVPQNGILY